MKPLAYAALTASILFVAGCIDSSTARETQPLQEKGGELLEFDVAEDMARFSFDDAPVFEDGMPAYGNSFVTRGYLYPHGFLEDHEATTAQGDPAHPDEVLGEWTCRGVFVGDGAHTESGPIVVTTQLYDIYDEPGYQPGRASGKNNVVSEGYELIDIGEAVSRPVTGGTGAYRGSRGEVEQVLLGFNESEGVNLRIMLDLD